MKYIDDFDNFDKLFPNNNYNSNKPFESELINGALLNDLERIKKALKNGEDINYQKNGDNVTALMMATYYQHYNIIDFLIKKGADWNIKDITGIDFVDMMNDFGEINYLKTNYPKEYENYLIKKDSEVYNL